MKTRNQTLLIIGGVILIALIAWIVLLLQEKRYSWYPNFSPYSEDPYGMQLRHNIWEKEPSRKVYLLKNNIGDVLDTTSTGANYVLINAMAIYDSLETEQLRKFVAKGNNALIAQQSFPTDFIIYHEADSCLEVTSNLLLKDSQSTYLLTEGSRAKRYLFPNYVNQYGEQDIREQWTFNTETFCKQRPDLAPLSFSSDGSPNVISMRYGKGIFIFCSTPEVFTNVYTLNDTLRTYQDALFSYLNPGNIYWDLSNSMPDFSNLNNNQPNENAKGPLSFILSQPALRNAWYIIMAMLATFLIFAIKRKQRPIPIVEPKPNTTVEYIETIQELFFLNNDHRKIAEYNIRHFIFRVNEKYFLHMNAQPDEAQIELLAAKSGYPLAQLQQLFKKIKLLEHSPVINDTQLIELYNYLESFYKFTQDGKQRN